MHFGVPQEPHFLEIEWFAHSMYWMIPYAIVRTLESHVGHYLKDWR